jgi:tryptophan-rich sensory protein
VSFQVIGLFIGLSTKSGMNPWYIDLNKSALTPPGYIFSIVWPLLYISLAIFGYTLYKEKTLRSTPRLSILYWLQMLSNWSWSYIFFNLQMTLAALMVLIFIIAINAFIMLILIRLNNKNWYIILPYFLWICFALYLNTLIVINN